MRALSASILIACLTAQAEAQAPLPKIDAALVAKIESQMVLPRGAQPLDAYQRFYAIAEINKKPVVRGVYVAGDGAKIVMRWADPVPGAPGAHVMKDGQNVPSIMDGGCSVIETVFDLRNMTPWTAEPAKPGDPTPTGFCHAEG